MLQDELYNSMIEELMCPITTSFSCAWLCACRVEALQQQEGSIRQATDAASNDKHKVNSLAPVDAYEMMHGL